MVSIKNVVVVGASGQLGAPILKVIVESGKFNVTVLTRASSNAEFPGSVKVVKADFESVESLTAALKGQDAVVSAVGFAGLAGQTTIIDAAIAAGVKRFLPSEYGSDLDNPLVKPLPVFGHKVAIQKHLEDVSAKSDLTYTLVRTGPFLDWGLKVGFLLDWKEGKPRIYDSGDQEFSTTTLRSIGLAIVGVLDHYEGTKNRAVYVQDIVTTQNRILAIAKKLTPEKKWEPVYTDLASLKKSSDEKLSKGEGTQETMYNYVFLSIFGEGYGGHFEKLDNQLFGIPGDKTDADIEAILKELFAQ
ncbi:hypothetical protein B7494_g1832 [Chlorociboria aeruginascens]|nr:hypothetical protein B7494_g1832 [Chlorociboria aeruginascens]